MFYLLKRALPRLQTAEAFRTEFHYKHKRMVRMRSTNSSLKNGNAFSQIHDLQRLLFYCRVKAPVAIITQQWSHMRDTFVLVPRHLFCIYGSIIELYRVVHDFRMCACEVSMIIWKAMLDRRVHYASKTKT